ncbi:MAG: lytic transglycosylase domain-containing protein [Leptolinea sp.]|nr:lytic transglycosylase domain-containing protein [Leptolinea sp.]
MISISARRMLPAKRRCAKGYPMYGLSSSGNLDVQLVMMQALIKLLEKTLSSKGVDSDLSELFGSSSSSKTSGSSANSSFESIIQKASQKYGVDADLVKAVIQNESNFDASAISSAGAMGLMQLMPATAESLGVENPLDPAENIEGGVKLLRELLNQFGGNLSNTLAAYNAGPGAVTQYDGVPPYQETQTYVKRVLSTYGKG